MDNLYLENIGIRAKEAAKTALKRAAKYHFSLEEIYISYMDFEAKERFTEEFARKYGENVDEGCSLMKIFLS